MKIDLCRVRGSLPAAGAEYARVGGNTSCIALAHDGAAPTLVLDAGTGLRRVSTLMHGAAFRGTVLLGHGCRPEEREAAQRRDHPSFQDLIAGTPSMGEAANPRAPLEQSASTAQMAADPAACGSRKGWIFRSATPCSRCRAGGPGL